jgi:hypothetical protein
MAREYPRLDIPFSREFMRPRAADLAPLPARKKRSFLTRAVVAGFGQAGRVEFDRITAFVATGGKETTNGETGQGKNNTAHYLPPIREHARPLLARDCRAGQANLSSNTADPKREMLRPA